MFRWMGGSEGRPAQEQGSPPPPTPQPNTTMPQTQIEMGSGASTSAAAYPAQVPATGGPNVSNEMRVTFPSGAPLGVGLLQRDGEVVVDDVQRTSLAEMVERAMMIANAKRPLAATSSTLTPRSRLKEDVAYTDALLDAIQEEQKRLGREKRHSV